MYSHRVRHIGLRVAVAGGAALVVFASTFIVPVPRVAAQSKETKETPGSTSTRVAGPASAPTFKAPAPAAAKTLVSKYAPGALATAEPTAVTAGRRTERQGLVNVVLVLDASGNVIGAQTTQVLEILMNMTNPKQELQRPEPQMTEEQMRERRAAEQREQAANSTEVRTEPRLVVPNEDEARARRAAAEQEAKELAAHLISIDVVRYDAGAIADRPVTVYFITTNGSNKAK